MNQIPMLRQCLLQPLAVLMLTVLSATVSAECVVLLHGLARSASSMEDLASALRESGYRVVNVDYPSRTQTIEHLAAPAIERGVEGCAGDRPVHFVTHSLGGILVRYYLANHELPGLGRVVMLGPPNQGSEVVDVLSRMPGFGVLNGPAGSQLGTDDASVPMRLGPADFELGIIAGTGTFNPILSQLLPNPDDGKVSVASTKLDGMDDFFLVQRSHPFIMSAPEVIEQVKHFLAYGRFDHDQR